jgi:hypothetical protein
MMTRALQGRTLWVGRSHGMSSDRRKRAAKGASPSPTRILREGHSVREVRVAGRLMRRRATPLPQRNCGLPLEADGIVADSGFSYLQWKLGMQFTLAQEACQSQ